MAGMSSVGPGAPRRWPIAAAAVAVALASACGASEAGSSGGRGGDASTACTGEGCPAKNAEGCDVITPTSTFRFSATANSGWFTAAYGTGVEPELGKGWQGLSIKLPPRKGPFAPGRVDLAAEPDTTGDCRHCVYVSYEGSGDHFLLAIATKGTLEIEEVDTDRGVLKGVLRDVTFRHLKEVALHSFAGLHEDSRCIYVAEAPVDTRPVPGKACLEAGDCPNAKLQACDPKTRTCADVACTEDSPTCPGDGVCQIQDPFYGVGACYARCAPFTSGACPEGQDCVPVDYVGETGVCKAQGPEAPEPISKPKTGRSCEPRQIATGCGPGHVCATHAIYWHYDHCYRQCDYFADAPGCPSGRCWLKLHTKKEVETTYLCGRGDCHFGGLCAETDDTTGFETPCKSDAEVGDGCRGDDQRSGTCVKDTDGSVVCRRFCRLGGTDCPNGQQCEPVVLAAGTKDERSFEPVGLGACRK